MRTASVAGPSVLPTLKSTVYRRSPLLDLFESTDRSTAQKAAASPVVDQLVYRLFPSTYHGPLFQERIRMKDLSILDCGAGGHCLFRVVAHFCLGHAKHYQRCRDICADWLRSNRQSVQAQQLVDELRNVPLFNTSSQRILTLDQYCAHIRAAGYGDTTHDLQILANHFRADFDIMPVTLRVGLADHPVACEQPATCGPFVICYIEASQHFQALVPSVQLLPVGISESAHNEDGDGAVRRASSSVERSVRHAHPVATHEENATAPADSRKRKRDSSSASSASNKSICHCCNHTFLLSSSLQCVSCGRSTHGKCFRSSSDGEVGLRCKACPKLTSTNQLDQPSSDEHEHSSDSDVEPIRSIDRDVMGISVSMLTQSYRLKALENCWFLHYDKHLKQQSAVLRMDSQVVNWTELIEAFEFANEANVFRGRSDELRRACDLLHLAPSNRNIAAMVAALLAARKYSLVRPKILEQQKQARQREWQSSLRASDNFRREQSTSTAALALSGNPFHLPYQKWVVDTTVDTFLESEHAEIFSQASCVHLQR